jgi:hypothetical protein
MLDVAFLVFYIEIDLGMGIGIPEFSQDRFNNDRSRMIV